MSPKQQSVAQPVDLMQGDINLNSKTEDGSCYIDLTYSQFKKYQQLIKDDKNKLKEEVYKDQSKFDVRRVLFGDDEIRKSLLKDRHDGIEYLERKFGTGYSDADRVRPPSATYTFLVREKSPATLRREKNKLREWNKQQAVARKEQRLAEIKRLVRENSYSHQRYFGGSDEAGHAADASDDTDDLYATSRDSKQSFLSQITPRTTDRSHHSPNYGRRNKSRRKKPRHLPPIDLNLRRLTIRIPSIFDRPTVIEDLDSTELAEKPHQLPPLLGTELTNVSSVTFQYPQQGRKNVSRINDEWVAMRERRKTTAHPDDQDTRPHHHTTVDKWRLLNTAQEPPSITVFVSYPPDGKVVIKRRKVKKK